MKKLKLTAFVGNNGHFDNEIDFALRGLGRHEVDDIKPQTVADM